MKMLDKKTKLFFKVLLTTALIFSLFVGCSKSNNANNTQLALSKSNDDGEFIYGIQTEPDNLDPYKASTADTRKILFNVFEGLLKPDKDGNIILAVAESYKISDDALTYSFKIRKGIKFHNGNAVNAEDVKYSLDQAIENKVNGFENVKSIDVVDESDINITLKNPDSDFLPYLTNAIIPKDYKDQSTKPVGTGPFEFKSFTPGQSLVLKKNKDYWQSELPHLDEVRFKLESDTSALLLDLQSEAIDCAAVDNATALQVDTNKFDIEEENSNAVQQLSLNNAIEPFNNSKVRKAISYVVDPDEIIKTVNFDRGVRVGTPIIPGLKKYYANDLTNAYKKDIQKAKELLKEAGYENGFSFNITVPSNYKVHVDTAQVIVNELKEIGITVDIKQVDWATWLSEVYKNKQYEATIISIDSATLSPKGFMSRYVSTEANNFINYKNSDYDELYNKAASELNEEKRIELFKQAQKLLSDDAASVYIEDIASITVLKKGFSGFTSYPLYVFDASTIYKAS